MGEMMGSHPVLYGGWEKISMIVSLKVDFFFVWRSYLEVCSFSQVAERSSVKPFLQNFKLLLLRKLFVWFFLALFCLLIWIFKLESLVFLCLLIEIDWMVKLLKNKESQHSIILNPLYSCHLYFFFIDNSADYFLDNLIYKLSEIGKHVHHSYPRS